MARKVETIRKQMAQLERELKAAEKSNSKGIEAVRKVMARHGVAIEDLKGSRVGTRHALAGRQAPVRYRDKDGNTWSGRGRPARWLVAAEKAGKKRESFLVK